MLGILSNMSVMKSREVDKTNICTMTLLILTTLNIKYCSSSSFRSLKNYQTNFFDVTKIDYLCVNIQVTVLRKSTFSCAHICANPAMIQWTSMHKKILQDAQLKTTNLQCHYFSFDGDITCTLGVSNEGMSLPEQEVVDGILLGISDIGGKMSIYSSQFSKVIEESWGFLSLRLFSI